MTTLNDMVIRTRRRVLSDLREETDTLGADIPANATSLSLAAGQSLGAIRNDAILEIDYELFMVTSDPTSGGGIQVMSGYLDTASTAHTAGSIITVNPRFPNADLATAINEDIDDLSSPTSGLFQVLDTTVSYNSVFIGYDLTDVNSDNVQEILEIRTDDYGPSQSWGIIPPSMYKLQRNTDPSSSPSGLSIKLYGGGYTGRPVRILYKAPYSTPLINPSDNVQQITGLHPQAHDIPQLGAAIRLMSYRELKRSFSESQGEPKRASEIPPGSSLTAIKGLQQLRAERVAAERSRLHSMYKTGRYA